MNEGRDFPFPPSSSLPFKNKRRGPFSDSITEGGEREFCVLNSEPNAGKRGKFRGDPDRHRTVGEGKNEMIS